MAASSPPARRTPPAACRWCRSTPSIRCSASSASATSSGRRPTPAPAASCWAPPPVARRCSARACSTRTATRSCSPRPCRPCQAYDPAFAYEVATIVQQGLQRMYGTEQQRGGFDPDVFYYLTLYNENYPMPAMPEPTSSPADIMRGPVPRGAARRGQAAPRHAAVLAARPGAGRARGRDAISPSTTTSASSCGRRRRTRRCATRRSRSSGGTACTPSQEPTRPGRRRSCSATTPARSSPSPTS